MSFNRAAIMKAAHFTAKWRVATVGGSYREWFAKALAYEWRRAKAVVAREESNLGLPIRSCPADVPAFRPRVQAAPATSRVMRFGSLRLFAGPGAHAAAIDDAASRVGARFQPSRNNGRRAAQWA
ncbi:hypothetical protein [Methylosinus sporium]|uniref:hypothetical protein n=1 Tax=Methylosinus sporium TaxID=428 RepID=UPI003839DD14